MKSTPTDINVLIITDSGAGHWVQEILHQSKISSRVLVLNPPTSSRDLIQFRAFSDSTADLFGQGLERPSKILPRFVECHLGEWVCTTEFGQTLEAFLAKEYFQLSALRSPERDESKAVRLDVENRAVYLAGGFSGTYRSVLWCCDGINLPEIVSSRASVKLQKTNLDSYIHLKLRFRPKTLPESFFASIPFRFKKEVFRAWMAHQGHSKAESTDWIIPIREGSIGAEEIAKIVAAFRREIERSFEIPPQEPQRRIAFVPSPSLLSKVPKDRQIFPDFYYLGPDAESSREVWNVDQMLDRFGMVRECLSQ